LSDEAQKKVQILLKQELQLLNKRLTLPLIKSRFLILPLIF